MDSSLLLAVIIILIIAFCFSPLGLGGGVLYMPVLHYLADWPIPEAILGSLTIVWMVALSSSLAHSKDGHADKEIANAGRITAIPSAIIGTVLAWLILSYVSDIVIKVFAALVLVFVIDRNLRKDKDISLVGRNISLYKKGAAIGGLSSGMLGLGGGAIYVTLNRRILAMDVHKASGTSYLISSAVVPMAILSHIIIEQSHTSVYDNVGMLGVLLIPATAFISAYIGARFAIHYLPDKIIRTTFIVAISATLLRYIWDITGIIL